MMESSAPGHSLPLKTKVSLPLLVRDWLKKRCPEQWCFHLREYAALVFDPLHGTNEEIIDHLVITSKSSHQVTFDYIIDITKTEVSVEELVSKFEYHRGANIRTRKLNWKSPQFFQQLGKVIRCQH